MKSLTQHSFAPALNEQASDWRWQAKHAARNLSQLEASLELSEEEKAGIEYALSGGFALSITPYYLSLCDKYDTNCPIRRQCMPILSEKWLKRGDLSDPLGEEAHQVAPSLIQRYPDRVLLLATDRCAVYCRFCTRSRMVGDGGGAQSLHALEQAFRYIEAHPEIRDVIISGGDPLVMSTPRVVSILERLKRIEHVDYVRMATRAPVTLPQRITEELCQAMKDAHPSLWIMTHFNHPKEITPESKRACSLLADYGFPVMNQSVLLRGVNDDTATLEQLFRQLVKMRVRPYYLLQMDPVRGTSHLRTPLRKGIEIMSALQGRISGIALPKFICDTPGGKGKVPLSENYIVTEREGVTTLKTFRGEVVDYIDPL